MEQMQLRSREFTKEQELVRHIAQMQLAREKGQSLLSWIDEHVMKFNNLINDDPSILDQIADMSTRDKALEQIKTKLYSIDSNN